MDLALVLVIGAISALALLVVILTLIDRQISMGTTYKDVDMAAWVQAGGSIFAILATGIGTWWAHHLERQRDREAELNDRAEAVANTASLMEEGHGIWEALTRRCRLVDWATPLTADNLAMPQIRLGLMGCVMAADQIPFGALPNQASRRAYLQFRGTLSYCVELLERNCAQLDPLQPGVLAEVERIEWQLARCLSGFKVVAKLAAKEGGAAQ